MSGPARMLVFHVGFIPVVLVTVVLVIRTARGIDATAILIISVVVVTALDACAARNTELRIVDVGIFSVGIITDIA